jgi:tRNA threonylcarbamoyladenosine biosynthesis protein TsaE
MNILERLKAGIISTSDTETENLARTLASQIPEDHTLALYGDLGSGKTTFIRGLASAWKINEPVTSPTYNILAIYRGERTLLHLDAFRLENQYEIEELMIDEFLSSPYCLAIEWPDNLENWLSDTCWKLKLEIRDETKRFIQML